jgi:dipeptidyl aminopeptidase/acylaminoacyl peptidase
LTAALTRSRWLHRAAGAAPRRLLHRALLRGLKPQRLAHEPPVEHLPRHASRLRRLDLTGARGQRLAAWMIVPDGAEASRPVPAVLALHGWGANASTLWPVVDPLLAAGMAVLLLDAGGHGDSGDEEYMSLPRFADDLATALAALRAEPAVDAGRVALLGHSVGAAACLLHAARIGQVGAVVSLAAFAHPRQVMERWLAEHRIPRRWIGQAILDHVQRVIGQSFDHIAPLNFVGRIDCPVLLVHGRHDRTVPLTDALALRQAGPATELLVVDGDHDLRAALAPHVPGLVDFLAVHLRAQAHPAFPLPRPTC